VDSKLKEGDILFQDLDCGGLCDAIETVTTGVDGKSFSHCALVVKVGDTLKVVEATGEAVQVNSLEKFFRRSGDTTEIRNVTVGRLNASYAHLIPDASAKAMQLVGQPYDHEFIMDNGKWYCSEMIYDVFKDANKGKPVFDLAPMTFKDPKTQATFPAWVSYYQNLAKPIPEGEPGINPGSISRSEKLGIVRIFW
jgi:uncharacterized protein YycO